jgi:EpsI family protein
MPDGAASPFAFLRRGPAIAVTCLLGVQAMLFYLAPTAEYVPNPPPLRVLSGSIGSWKMFREVDTEPETQALLRADDSINRSYAGPQGSLSLFVAFFKSQRGGVTPHSPKICLPANGWTPEDSRIISVSVPGEARPIPVNRYVVSHGNERSVVLYWYSTAHHVMADEYLSKLYLMHEGLLYRRSDEAVYRVIAPVEGQGGEERAENTAISFIQALYQPLRQQMWNQARVAQAS